jgi:hypothetical protein
MKDLWIVFVEGFSKEPKESLHLKEIRMILSGSWPKARGSASSTFR